MTPERKRQLGKQALGYVRVSSKGQRDGWSLETQAEMIRAWCTQAQIPLSSIVQAPEGWESGRDFDARAGWQDVERQLATGTIGWLVVAAVDRLSRNLQQLADKLEEWDAQDIAVIVPSLSGSDATGVSRFLIQILGMLSEHERDTIVARVIPGLKARLEAGLPLGRKLLGYRIAHTPASGGHGAPVRALEPDPTTAPVITGLFQLALAHPTYGDRRLAELAARAWPAQTWSCGRVSSILSNPAYTGTLLGTVGGEQILRLNNHPALVAPGVFARVQALRAQRAQDRARQVNAVRATSWLGGLVRCGRCHQAVQWRSAEPETVRHPRLIGVVRATGPGLYVCRGAKGAPCSCQWTIEIEQMVWRALEIVLERERSVLQRIGAAAIEQIPALLDERRAQCASTLEHLQHEEQALTERLTTGLLTPERYAAAIRALTTSRQHAQAQLQETDGWTYLARLLLQQEGPHAGRWRWITLQEALLPTHAAPEAVASALAERRRLLHAIAPEIVLHDPRDPRAVGSLDGPGEDHERGIFIGVRFNRPQPQAGISAIATALARLLVRHPGHDVEAGLAAAGWASDAETAAEVPAAKAWRPVDSEDMQAQVLAVRPHQASERPHPLPPPGSLSAVPPEVLTAPGIGTPPAQPIRLWLDDCRPRPAAYTHLAQTAAEAIALLETGRVIAVSLDHDLGDEAVVGSGYQVACHIEQGAHAGTLPRLEWAIHSANPVGRKRMEAALNSAERAWDAQADADA